MKLYNFFRSSSSHRLRIALRLKGLAHDYVPVDLRAERHLSPECATWIGSGFDAFEAMLAADSRRGRFCFGDAPTIADVYLVPQIESARRFNVDLARWPVIQTIDAVCAEIDAFRLAAPALQPDAL